MQGYGCTCALPWCDFIFIIMFKSGGNLHKVSNNTQYAQIHFGDLSKIFPFEGMDSLMGWNIIFSVHIIYNNINILE